jgi:hypothetical protein
MKPTALARIPIGKDELVVKLDGGRVDIRLSTLTGDQRFPSKHGVTLPRDCLNDLIAALEAAKKKGGQAIA